MLVLLIAIGLLAGVAASAKAEPSARLERTSARDAKDLPVRLPVVHTCSGHNPVDVSSGDIASCENYAHPEGR